MKLQTILEEVLTESDNYNKVVRALEKTKLPLTIIEDKYDDIEVIVGMNAPDKIIDNVFKALAKVNMAQAVSVVGDTTTYSRRDFVNIKKVGGGHKDY